MDSTVAFYWHYEVQPAIRQCSPTRADHDWNWKVIEAKVRGFAREGSRGFVLSRLDRSAPPGVKCSGRPIAVCACIGPWDFVVEQDESSVYGWFLASAPREVQEFGGVPRLGAVGRACLDSLLALSFQLGYSGRVWLHSDPKGGDALRGFYSACGMKELPLGIDIASLRENDGHIFFHDKVTSRITYDGMMGYRNWVGS
jgi:hypothetical protein